MPQRTPYPHKSDLPILCFLYKSARTVEYISDCTDNAGVNADSPDSDAVFLQKSFIIEGSANKALGRI